MPKILYPQHISSNKELPQVSARKEVAKSAIFTVEQTHLTFSNGNKAVYEAIKGGKRGAVLIVAVNDKNEMLLIREYCGGRECYELAFPKGKFEDSETMEEAANRELQEETGYRAEQMTFIKTVSIAPGYMGHVTHLLLAQNLHWSPLEGDEPESVEVYPWSFDQIEELIQREDFTEARSITALYIIANYLKDQR